MGIICLMLGEMSGYTYQFLMFSDSMVIALFCGGVEHRAVPPKVNQLVFSVGCVYCAYCGHSAFLCEDVIRYSLADWLKRFT